MRHILKKTEDTVFLSKVFRNCFCLLIISVLLVPLNAQWFVQNHPAGFYAFYDMQFINRNTGWITGENSTILKTTNGGDNWFLQQSNIVNPRTLHGISMVDENTGYIAGWFEVILKTTNGGINWIVLSEGTIGQGNSNNDVSFVNAQTGWISSFLGRVLKTTNGGVSWDTLDANTGGALRVIQFYNIQTGWSAGDGGQFRKTTNGGMNWISIFPGSTSDYWYNSLHFINENLGWLCSYHDKIYRTTNGGLQWSIVFSNSFGETIRFVDSESGWFSGGTPIRIYKTYDGGSNWYQQMLPGINGFASSIWVYSDSTAWVTAANKILHTTNGGGEPIGIVSNNTSIASEFRLEQNYPNPFNPQTTVEFSIDKKDNYELSIYNLLGEKIEVLFNEVKPAGKYKIQYTAEHLSSGTYYFVLSNNRLQSARKFVFIK